MFEATEWVLDESLTHDHATIEEAWVYHKDFKDQDYILSICKRFDFNSDAMRMSSVVRNLRTKAVYAYVKGSPERIAALCDKNTLPSDFD